jgi:hypothetical protein
MSVYLGRLEVSAERQAGASSFNPLFSEFQSFNSASA